MEPGPATTVLIGAANPGGEGVGEWPGVYGGALPGSTTAHLEQERARGSYQHTCHMAVAPLPTGVAKGEVRFGFPIYKSSGDFEVPSLPFFLSPPL